MTIKDILDEFSKDDKDRINRLSEKEKKVNEEIDEWKAEKDREIEKVKKQLLSA